MVIRLTERVPLQGGLLCFPGGGYLIERPPDMKTLIDQIIKRRQNDEWLIPQLVELNDLFEELRADRNRLIRELHRCQNEANKLKDDIFKCKLGHSPFLKKPTRPPS